MIRVCVTDDQTLVRQGIRHLLELSAEVTVTAEAADGDEALAVLEFAPPDVLLLDLRMPGRDGIATLTAMRERGLAVPTLVLTTFDDDELVLRALRAGASGYLLKDVTLDQVVTAIRTLAEGGTLVQPGLTERLLQAMRRMPDPDDPRDLPPQPLTDRERDVLRLVAAGEPTRRIAGQLGISSETVETHIRSGMRKLGARTRTEAAARLGQLT